MDKYELIFGIVVVVVIASVLKSYFSGKNTQGSESIMDDLAYDFGMADYYTKKELDPFMDKFEAMEQRIQVLERIATDKGRTLASEIDSLK